MGTRRELTAADKLVCSQWPTTGHFHHTARSSAEPHHSTRPVWLVIWMAALRLFDRTARLGRADGFSNGALVQRTLSLLISSRLWAIMGHITSCGEGCTVIQKVSDHLHHSHFTPGSNALDLDWKPSVDASDRASCRPLCLNLPGTTRPCQSGTRISARLTYSVTQCDWPGTYAHLGRLVPLRHLSATMRNKALWSSAQK